MKLTPEFKKSVLDAMVAQRTNYGGNDSAFAKSMGISPSIWSRLQNGETEGMLAETRWLEIGRKLDVNPAKKAWKLAETEVFEAISNDIIFCQAHSKAMIFVDLPEIGKTKTAEYLAKKLKNCFYIDCSQAKTKQLFIRTLAQTVGIDHSGRFVEVKANIKYYMKMLEKPIIILDEAGDLEYPAFLELKELWNATEGYCGWYMMGADGLRAKIERGIRGKKVGYREIFSRFSGKFLKIVPSDQKDRLTFYRKLITDAITANVEPGTDISELVKKCLVRDENGEIGGLRRAETLLILQG